MNRFAITFVVCTALAVSAAMCIGQQATPNHPETGNPIRVTNSLLLLSANILQPSDRSDPVVVYRITAEKNLIPFVTVLEARSGEPLRNSLTGVYSVHDIGPYLTVDYPHIFPREAIFVPKEHPEAFQKIDIGLEDTNDLIVDKLDHDFSEAADGTICDLWPVFIQPSVPDGKGGMTEPKASLRSACKKPGGLLFLKVNQWDDYKNLRFDGDMRYTEISFLSDKGGKLTEVRLGGQPIPLGNMPAGFDSPSDNRGVPLEAANSRYIVISIADANDSQDRNTNVFVKTLSDGKWKRLPVLPLSPMPQDKTPLEQRQKMYYRLFDDWLVTSASATLLAANQITETIVPDLLTVVPTGKQWADWGIKVEPTTDVAGLPSRRITLWNLADGRSIDLAIPEDDSEIIHIFDDHTVLLRIHDKLFFAEIEGSKLTGYKLAAFDSAIPQVHWAFYSQQ